MQPPGYMQGPFASEQIILIDDFYKQANLVNNMVNNMLAWANNQEKGINIEKNRLNIIGVVDEILSVSGFQAKNKHANKIKSEVGNGSGFIVYLLKA